MTDYQENKLSHFFTIRQLCDNNHEVWKNYQPFVGSYHAFVELVPLIEQNRDLQMLNISGVTEDKAALRTDLVERAWFITQRLQSFASVNSNDSLLRSIKLSISTLTRSSDTSLIGRASIIHQKASENISSLEPYGIPQQHVDELETTTGHFTTTLSSIKDAQSARTTATSSLKRLFSEVSGILRQRLDLDAHYFKNTNADFFKQYITIRGLDKKGRKRKRKNGKEE
jgi:hypothetical protein